MKQIVCGDNLAALAALDDSCAALAYLDPPFNTGRRFEQHGSSRDESGSDGTRSAFSDSFTRGEVHVRAEDVASREMARQLNAIVSLAPASVRGYLAMLAPRLVQVRRVLKPTGSIFVHCDPTASHWIRVLMDVVFGAGSAVNEIVWRRTAAHGSARRFAPVHDTILFYTAGGRHVWTDPHRPYDDAYLARYFRHRDERGAYQLITCTAPGNRPGTRAHYRWRGAWPPPGRHWAYVEERMRELEAEGRLVYSSSGTVRQKRYVDDGAGVRLTDWWDDVTPVSAHGGERVGWETQKPIALLQRIIAAVTEPGDLVIDPFAGSGTTAVAAQHTGRDFWVSDTSIAACSLALGRLRQGDAEAAVRLTGFPNSERSAMALFETDPLAFGTWGTGILGTLLDRKGSTHELARGHWRHRARVRTSAVPLTPRVNRGVKLADVALNVPGAAIEAERTVELAACVSDEARRRGGVRGLWG